MHFGKFELLQHIGGGKLSQVFRVSREGARGPAPRVALKRVQPSLIGEPAFVQLVVREAGLLARLSHPLLCCCQEMGVIDGCAFLTLDLVDGCTLRALMRRLSGLEIQLPPSAIVALGHQLAQVLDHVHRECGVVHLDLSPQNVMISREGEIRLIDFGIARFLDGHDPPPLGGKIAGTVGYMSPEQARGDAADARADQFGLGVLMWELLSGRRLFQGHNRKTWRRMRKGQTPDPDRALGKISDDLRAVVCQLLAPAPNSRFRHMDDAIGALESATSDPSSGRRPLAALIHRLMDDEDFDPFDVVQRKQAPEAIAADIPTGDDPRGLEEYEELTIQVDHGEGTPGSLVRSVVPDRQHPPTSPFLETIPDNGDSSD